jgi:glycosyltransferase involved in cell wall biosynthesis
MTYPLAFLHHGGGEREIHLLKEALSASGLLADIYGPTSLPLSSYDVVIGFSINEDLWPLIAAARNAGKHLILWPNLWFINEPTSQQVGSLAKYISYFDMVVFKSNAELLHFSRYFDVSGDRILRVKPLISPKFSQRIASDVFRETYELDRYAIWPGIIEPQKNQLAAVRLFKHLDFELIISGSVRDQAYAERCRQEAGSNVKFIPALPFGSEVHLSALSNCALFIEMPLDFPGASALEAAAIGCPLLLSKSEWTQELLGDCCIQVEPQDTDAMRVSVNQLSEFGNYCPKYIPQVMDKAIQPLLSYLKKLI